MAYNYVSFLCLFSSSILLLAGFGCSHTATGKVAGDGLINGDFVAESDLPSTLALRPLVFADDGSFEVVKPCSGIRVGPRHILTAAHCVTKTAGAKDEFVTSDLREDYASGKRIGIIASNNATEIDLLAADNRIKQTHVIPSWKCWIEASEEKPNPLCTLGDMMNGSTNDLAVIVFEDELSFPGISNNDDVPSAFVSFGPLLAGAPIVKQGFGCKQVEDDGLSETIPTLTSSKSGVGGSVTYNKYWATHSPGSRLQLGYDLPVSINASASQAAVCFGDSGGPVTLEGTNGRVVVGVNSGFLKDRNADVIAKINSYNYNVFEWLRGLIPQTSITTDHVPPQLAVGNPDADIFNAQEYLDNNPWLVDQIGNDLEAAKDHYMRTGRYLGLSGRAQGSPKDGYHCMLYLEANFDTLISEGIVTCEAALRHKIANGGSLPIQEM